MNERLGRGLGALIPESDETAQTAAGITLVPVGHIKANRYQPRRRFVQEKLTELAMSIRENGIIQPIIVTKTASSEYELIAGERRLEAAKLAGLENVPVVVRSVSRKEQLELAIIENVQREDLNPIEEAMAYRMLISDFQLTHNDVAQKMAKDRVTITNSLRLLNLSEEIQELVSSGELSAGHARAILSLPAEEQSAFAAFILKHKLTVRQAEDKARTWGQEEAPRAAKVSVKNSLLHSFEQDLSRLLKVKATIKDSRGKGKITLEYSSPEELESLKTLLFSLKQ
jgi:ParB family chromosome partitioning protein